MYYIFAYNKYFFQALTASELVHLLKADVLQATTEAESEQKGVIEESQADQSVGHKSADNN